MSEKLSLPTSDGELQAATRLPDLLQAMHDAHKSGLAEVEAATAQVLEFVFRLRNSRP